VTGNWGCARYNAANPLQRVSPIGDFRMWEMFESYIKYLLLSLILIIHILLRKLLTIYKY
jgi:uncharacterized membrane protein